MSKLIEQLSQIVGSTGANNVGIKLSKTLREEFNWSSVFTSGSKQIGAVIDGVNCSLTSNPTKGIFDCRQFYVNQMESAAWLCTKTWKLYIFPKEVLVFGKETLGRDGVYPAASAKLKKDVNIEKYLYLLLEDC